MVGPYGHDAILCKDGVMVRTGKEEVTRPYGRDRTPKASVSRPHALSLSIALLKGLPEGIRRERAV